MNNQQDNQNLNNAAELSQGASSVGSKLREAREQLGLSVSDVANRIKFAPKQIEWLEADDYVRLPEAAFVRGFVRSYARLVELEPTSLLASLPSSHVQTAAAPELKSVEIAMPSALSARRHNIVWLVAALAVALSLAIFERMHERPPVKEESVNKTVTQALELPNASAVSETALLADQEQKPEEMYQVQAPVQNVPDATAVTAQQPAIKQAARTSPVAAPSASTAPVLTASTKPAPVQQSVQAAQPVPVQVPAQVKAKAPVAAPVTATAAPAPAKPLEKPKAPAIAPVTVPEPKESETSSSDNSFSFSNFFKRKTAPAADMEPSRPEVTAKPSAEAPVKATAETGSDHSLRLEFDEDAWVEIKDNTGKVLISKMHSAGSLVRVAGKSPLDVTIGNAKAVRLFDKGKKINLARYTTAEVAHIKLK